MARFFAFNSLARANRNSTDVANDTTAGRFDSAYVASALRVQVGGTNGVDYFEVVAPFDDGSASATTIWLRFDYWNSASASTEIVKFLNGGVNAYRIVGAGGNTQKFQYWNSGTSAWVDWGSAYSVSASTLHTIVVKLVSATSFEIFVDGVSVASSASAPTNPQSAIDAIRFESANANSATYYSQIMGADYDIRDAHFMAAALNGNSVANTDGTGAYTDVNETVLNDGTAIALSTVGHRKGQTKASITVPSGHSVAAAILNARGRVGGGVVTDGKLGFRSGGSNYAGTGRSYGGGYSGRGHIVAVDPATSTAWSQTTFNNAEPFSEAA